MPLYLPRLKITCLHRLGKVSACVLLASVLTACSDSTKQRAESHAHLGQRYLDEGNVEKARVELKNAVAIDPKNIDAIFLLGQIYEQMGEWRKALAAYQSVIEKQAGHTNARLKVGRLYLRGGVADKALSMAGAILEAQPENLEALQMRASAYMLQNETVKAVTLAERILEQEPGYSDAVVLLALHYNNSGKPARAIALLEEGIHQNPVDTTLLYLLARTLSSAGQMQQATGLVNELIEREPENPGHRIWLATMHAKQGRLDDAQAVLENMVVEFQDDTDARRMIADYYIDNGNRDRAIGFLKEELAKTPDEHDLWFYLMEQYERAGDTDQARKAYAKLINSGEEGIHVQTARKRLAQLLYNNGNLDAASQLVADIIEVNPRDNDALILRGMIALKRKQPEDAILDFRSVLKDQPYSARLLTLLASAHLAADNPYLAREVLERSVENNPGDAQSRVVLAQLLLKQNNTRRAGTMASEALHLAPGHLGAMDILARIRVAEGDWDGVLQVAGRMVVANPEGPDGYLYSGLAKRGLGDIESASVMLKTAMELAPGNDAALTAYVGVQLEAGQSSEAQRQTAMFLDEHPGNQTAQNLLGEVLMFRKEYRAAADAFRKAINLNRQSAVPYRNLGLALRALGDEQGAQRVFRQGLKEVKGDPRSSALLQSHLSSGGTYD